MHTSAEIGHVIRTTRPARPAEYADLRRELERIGYVLRIVHRDTFGRSRADTLRRMQAGQPA